MNHRQRLLILLATCLVTSAVPVIRAQDANGIYAKVDEPPVPVKTPPPKYPQELRREGINGVVAVVVVIDETGAVAEASVSKASHPAFEQPSLEAVKAWKFKAAKVGGNAVKVRVTIPLRFSTDS